MVKENLNLNDIVSKRFDDAARHLGIHQGLLHQIKSCNAVYYRFNEACGVSRSYGNVLDTQRREHLMKQMMRAAIKRIRVNNCVTWLTECETQR